MSNQDHPESTELFSTEFNQNPYPGLSSLRKSDPIYRTLMPNGQYAWVVTRYEDAVEVLKDQRFSKDRTKLFDDGAGYDVMGKNMLFSDLPDHKRLRSLVQKAFTPRMIEGLRGRVEEITNELIDDMEGQKEADFINAFAFPLPIIVICEMLGVPTEDRDKFREWSNTLIEASNNPEQAMNTGQSLMAFMAYIQNWITERRKDPQDDLITDLIQAEEGGDQFTEEELCSLVFLLIVAGHETTVNLISNGLLALLEHPDQKRKLQENPELIHTAVEEFLRYDGAVMFSTDRWASETITWGDKVISQGDLVIVALGSADRDPEHFADPDVFDITREKSRHLAFGKGIHACLGAPLARLEAEIAINTVLRRLPHIKLNTTIEQLKWRPSTIIRGMEEFPVTF
ncbi:cytochrome P450 family protein [Bacillus piscicola]|uniref:cytochrome P450 family protein n=1 Tax=Bacillus piscicola TaxID=1632684 RepID=UPI001F091E43